MKILNKIEHSVKDLEHFGATNHFFTLKIHHLFRVNLESPRVFLLKSVCKNIIYYQVSYERS